MNVVLRFQLRNTGQQSIQPGERAALISGDERCDAAVGAVIPFVLFDQLTRNGLDPCHQNRPGLRPVAISEINGIGGGLHVVQFSGH